MSDEIRTGAVDQLDVLVRGMAGAVKKWLPTATRGQYADYLDAMSHHTRESAARLREAARSFEGELAETFERMAGEEEGHHALALADLEALGKKPSEAPPPDVADFQKFWRKSMAGKPVAYAGALYVLESVTQHLAEEAPKALARLELGDDEKRFVTAHLEADSEQAQALRGLVDQQGAKDEAALLFGGKLAGAAWVGMHRRALAPRE